MICLYGKRGQGKTFIALDWACCIAAAWRSPKAHDWAKEKVSPGRVAYLLAESPDGLKRRVHGWIQHRYATRWRSATEEFGCWLFGDESPSPSLLVAQKRLAIDSKEQRDALIASLAPLMPLSLIVLDPLVSFMNGSENDTRDMQEFVEGVRDLVKRCDCSVLLVHHEGKGNVNNSLGARGSSALEAGMDTVIHMKGVNQYESDLEFTKQREAQAHADMRLRFHASSYSGKWPLGKFPTLVEPDLTKITKAKKDRKDTKKEKLEQIRASYLEAVERVEASPEADKKPTIERIFAALPQDLQKSMSTTNRMLQDLAKNGHIVKVGRKGKTLLHFLPLSVPTAEQPSGSEGQ